MDELGVVVEEAGWQSEVAEGVVIGPSRAAASIDSCSGVRLRYSNRIGALGKVRAKRRHCSRERQTLAI